MAKKKMGSIFRAPARVQRAKPHHNRPWIGKKELEERPVPSEEKKAELRKVRRLSRKKAPAELARLHREAVRPLSPRQVRIRRKAASRLAAGV